MDEAAVARVAHLLSARGRSSVILVRAAAGEARGLTALDRICTLVGAKPMTELVTGKMLKGAGLFPLVATPYRAEHTVAAFSGVTDLVLVGTRPPVAPFAYPNYPSWCVPDETAITYLSHDHEDEVLALEALADHLGAPAAAARSSSKIDIARPAGVLDAAAIGRSIARHLPEGAIVSEEAISNAHPIVTQMATAAPHIHLALTGGAIGQGIPLATGAAVAAPECKVVNIQADGSAMYTLQALWTQARENLDVTTVILANRAYGVLKAEVERVGASIENERAVGLLSLGAPNLDWVALARGMGIEGVRATSAEQFDDLFASAVKSRGPRLIEAVIG